MRLTCALHLHWTIAQPDLTVDEAHEILRKCRSELEQRFLIRNGKWLYKVRCALTLSLSTVPHTHTTND